MSVVTPGGKATDAYQNLAALLEFVKSPDYMARVQELSALENSSRAAMEEANAAITKSDKLAGEVAQARAKLDADSAKLAADVAAHKRQSVILGNAMQVIRDALEGKG